MSITSQPVLPPTAYQLEKSVSEYQQLWAKLSEDTSFLPDEDEIAALLADAGGVHPRVLLARLIDAAIWADRRADQADELRKRYIARRDRYLERRDAIRATIVTLLDVLGLKAWESAEGAADIRRTPASVVITDIAKVPDELKTVEVVVTPHKIPIGAKLRAGETVEGAELSNPSMGLRITPF